VRVNADWVLGRATITNRYGLRRHGKEVPNGACFFEPEMRPLRLAVLTGGWIGERGSGKFVERLDELILIY
jgi:hypothetical protein